VIGNGGRDQRVNTFYNALHSDHGGSIPIELVNIGHCVPSSELIAHGSTTIEETESCDDGETSVDILYPTECDAIRTEIDSPVLLRSMLKRYFIKPHQFPSDPEL
jgi:hypothetical protein